MPQIPNLESIKKVLLLGSGGLSIGQAGEFDYSGTQAVKSLLEENIEVIIVNPNIATVQTNPKPNTKVYLYPVTPEWIEKVIVEEKPNAIIGGFGGQTALNCLIKLDENGILDKYGVINLGTDISTLIMTEDRDLFAKRMKELSLPIPPSYACESVAESLEAANKIGYPVIARAAYALGGLGSGFAENDQELRSLVNAALSQSPQVLVEKSLKGWKEVEYEIMRDACGNAITICNMENFDALGIHTGDSIVVAPSQSLTDHEYQILRRASLKMVQSFEIVGECNAQFALCPETSEFYVIEVNARLSRSSALASKASGYPIAHIAAKVVLGHNLISLKNPVTGITSAFYEPALDYVTVKAPRWDLLKFDGVSRNLGSTMKSVGEIMSIGRNFPEALQKAIRMVSEQSIGLSIDILSDISEQELDTALTQATDTRLYSIITAFRKSYSIEKVNHLTGIDKWFLSQIQIVTSMEQDIRLQVRKTFGENIQEKLLIFFDSLSRDTWKKWKVFGFNDEQIAYIILSEIYSNKNKITPDKILKTALNIRKHRQAKGVVPVVKKIDTTAAEYPSPSNYLYVTYEGEFNDTIPTDSKRGVIILGGGAYRIGTSVEFDWCAVSCSERLKKAGLRSIIINCNPETVSTDFNCSDRLYFEELTIERILDIGEFEQTQEVITSMGGQLPNKIAGALASSGMSLLGHSAKTIDNAENRSHFSALLDQLDISQPTWTAVTSKSALNTFIDKIGFPVLIRPSYVLSGAAMKVAYNHESLNKFLSEAAEISQEYPVVVSSFLTGAREVELDGVAKEGQIVTSIVSEHIENAGIHSGDATTVVPAQMLFVETVRQVKRAGAAIAAGLNLNGPFNIQFLAKDNRIKVIECNARAARSFPFISKVVGLNLAEVATDVMCGQSPELKRYIEDELPYVGVKAAMFSFTRLQGADPVIGVEMSSTGEVGCLALNFDEALLLALEASHITQPKKGVLISAGMEKEKMKFLPAAKTLQKLGLPLYATEGTGNFLQKHGIEAKTYSWSDDGFDAILDLIRKGDVDLVLNCPKNNERDEIRKGSIIRQTASQFACPLLTNMEKITAFVRAIKYRHESSAPYPILPLQPFKQ
mgnify:CR=1 FL=1